MASTIALGVVVLIQIVPAKSTLHWIATVALSLGGLVALGLRHRVKVRGTIDDPELLATGCLLTLMTLVTLAYIGPFSAGAAALCLLVFFFGSSSNDLKGLTVYAASACGYFALTIASLAGLVHLSQAPIGIVTSTRGLVLLSLVVQGMLFASFYAARTNRQLFVQAIRESSEVRHRLRRHEVELVRARASLPDQQEAVFGKLSGLRLGRYRLGEVIGRGGMGEVYRALRTDDDQPVAVKVLTESMRDDPLQVERFFREAQVCGELDSPHIVKILDAAWSEDGRYPYLAMELLEGQDLGSHLRTRGPLPLRDVVDLVQDVSEALSCAHAVGIIHRDMKPENVFLAHAPTGARWKVLDFGISKMRDSRGTLTRNGVIGTPNYMSPEQAQGAPLDTRTDIFALGSIVYRVLTGRLAFDAQEPLAALLQVMNEMPVDPAELCSIPEDVELTLAVALAKDRTTRFSCARDFAEAFRAAARSALDDDLRARARVLLRDKPWTPSDTLHTKPSVDRAARMHRPVATPSSSDVVELGAEDVLLDETPSDTASLPAFDLAAILTSAVPTSWTGPSDDAPAPRVSRTRARIPRPAAPPRASAASRLPLHAMRRGTFVEDDTLPLEDVLALASGDVE